MKNKRSTRALRGLTGLTSSLLVVALGTTTIANAWASKINEYLGTTNISVSGETSDSDDAYYYKSDYDNTTDLINARNDVMTKIQEEGTVLLKNDNQALPLKNSPKVTLFGMTSYAPVYGGTVGSSSPAKQDLSFKDCFENAGIQVNPTMWSFYEKMSKDYKRMALAPTWFGFTGAEMKAQTIRTGEVPFEKYTDTERESYSDYNDAAVVVIGRQGSEADDFGTSTDNVQDGDGTHLALGLQDVERDMINEAKKNFDKVIVLVNSNNPMEIEELKEDKDIDSILWIGEPGTVGLQGVASVLTGEVSPSGHLPDTYAVSSVSSPAMVNFGSYTFTNATEDNFGASNYSGSNYLVESEGIYTGYKYYETRYEDTVLKQGNADSAAGASNDNGTWNYDEEVSYGFGYGLSYTSFEYSNLRLSANAINEGDPFTVTFTVKNVGKVAGAEIAQLYVSDVESTLYRPAKELKGFKKVFLQPGEEKDVEINLDSRAFAYYNVAINDWHVESGDFKILVGASSRDIKLEGIVNVASKNPDAPIPDYKAVAPCYYDIANATEIPVEQFEALYGAKMIENKPFAKGELQACNTIGQCNVSPFGRFMYRLCVGVINLVALSSENSEMLTNSVKDMPYRTIAAWSMGIISKRSLDGLVDMLNGRKGGFRRFLKGFGKEKAKKK